MAPDKPKVAKALLARRKEKLVAEAHQETLTTLDSELQNILGKATTRLAQTSSRA